MKLTYRRAGRAFPEDDRALVLAVSLMDEQDGDFERKLFAGEDSRWNGVPNGSFVHLRKLWDSSMDGEFGPREVSGWTNDQCRAAGDAVNMGLMARRVHERPLRASDALKSIWSVGLMDPDRQSVSSRVVSTAPTIFFDEPKVEALSGMRAREPYFLSDDGFAVGVSFAFYVVDRAVLAQFERELYQWLLSEMPEAIDFINDGERKIDDLVFGPWVTRRCAEAWVRRLTFEETARMMMDDRLREDTAWT